MATMLQRMFSSQLFGMAIDSTLPEESAAQEHSTDQDVDMPDRRYPKRKRAVVSYLDGGSDFDLSDDEEEDIESKAKVQPYSLPLKHDSTLTQYRDQRFQGLFRNTGSSRSCEIPKLAKA
jgi:hypothetical protein